MSESEIKLELVAGEGTPAPVVTECVVTDHAQVYYDAMYEGGVRAKSPTPVPTLHPFVVALYNDPTPVSKDITKRERGELIGWVPLAYNYENVNDLKVGSRSTKDYSVEFIDDCTVKNNYVVNFGTSKALGTINKLRIYGLRTWDFNNDYAEKGYERTKSTPFRSQSTGFLASTASVCVAPNSLHYLTRANCGSLNELYKAAEIRRNFHITGKYVGSAEITANSVNYNVSLLQSPNVSIMGFNKDSTAFVGTLVMPEAKPDDVKGKYTFCTNDTGDIFLLTYKKGTYSICKYLLSENYATAYPVITEHKAAESYLTGHPNVSQYSRMIYKYNKLYTYRLGVSYTVVFEEIDLVTKLPTKAAIVNPHSLSGFWDDVVLENSIFDVDEKGKVTFSAMPARDNDTPYNFFTPHFYYIMLKDVGKDKVPVVAAQGGIDVPVAWIDGGGSNYLSYDCDLDLHTYIDSTGNIAQCPNQQFPFEELVLAEASFEDIVKDTSKALKLKISYITKNKFVNK